MQQGPAGDSPQVFIGAPPGSPAPVRERDTRGNGGGFAPLEAFCRRVAGVSRLYWCNSPRLVAVRPRSGVVRARSGAVRPPQRRPPRRNMADMGLMGETVCDAGNSGTQFTPAIPPRAGLDGGGFAPLEASLRRVAGVSRLYWCNSPRLVAMSSAGKSHTGPRAAQFPQFAGGEVTPRGGAAHAHIIGPTRGL